LEKRGKRVVKKALIYALYLGHAFQGRLSLLTESQEHERPEHSSSRKKLKNNLP